MMPYFGHRGIVQAVDNHLPAVSLFLGPASVGKWELAEHIRFIKKFKNSDVLRVRRLTQENARFIVRFASERPKGFARLVIARLTEQATRGAQNTLLKALEESPDTYFILIAEEEPLPTIRSRATVFNFGLLSDEDVFNILLQRRNYSADKALEYAKISGGQVNRALSHGQDKESKMLVLRAIDAIHRRDANELESLAPLWQEEHTELLTTWCYEALTSQWKKFSREDSAVVGTRIPLRILMTTREDLRPRLIVRAALASVLQEQR